MVKGCEKRIVRLKDPDSRVFEEVLFILRDEAGHHGPAHERDIVAEANRILRENTAGRESVGRSPRTSLLFFLIGAAVMAAVMLPLALL